MEDAKFSYTGGEGWVTFDETMTSPAEFLGELSRLTAFTGTVREFVSAESVPEDETLDGDFADDGGDGHDHSDVDHEHASDENQN